MRESERESVCVCVCVCVCVRACVRACVCVNETVQRDTMLRDITAHSRFTHSVFRDGYWPKTSGPIVSSVIMLFDRSL